MSRKRRERRIRTLDLFCGLGGSSWGARQAGATIVAGIDVWNLATDTFADNFPKAKTFRRKLEHASPRILKEEIGRIDLLLASPECTNHTAARGDRDIDEDSRETAFQVTRFVRVFQPRWIVIENVVNMRKWDRYEEFLQRLRNLGYHVREEILDSAHFGVPQARRRLYILCDRKLEPKRTRGKIRKMRVARTAISLNGQYPPASVRRRKLAERTQHRIRSAKRKLGRRAFLLVYYGNDKRGEATGGWQRLNVPLRTVTTLDRFALVRPNGRSGYTIRMLQVRELAKAMGFPPSRLRLKHGTRRDKIHLLGNAVCPPVMRAIVRTLTGE